jgi:hypothetical protein
MQVSETEISIVKQNYQSNVFNIETSFLILAETSFPILAETSFPILAKQITQISEEYIIEVLDEEPIIRDPINCNRFVIKEKLMGTITEYTDYINGIVFDCENQDIEVLEKGAKKLINSWCDIAFKHNGVRPINEIYETNALSRLNEYYSIVLNCNLTVELMFKQSVTNLFDSDIIYSEFRNETQDSDREIFDKLFPGRILDVIL